MILLMSTAYFNLNAQWLTNYCYRKSITIDAIQVDDTDAADLTSFPILISMTDNDLRTMANDGNVENSNGWDITFTSDDGTTELDLQLENYTASTGNYIAWVNIPTLDYDDNTIIYLYYGNGAIASDPSVETVWDSNFAAVWHLNEDTGDQILDATANNMDESVNAGVPYTYTYTKNTNTSSIDGVVSKSRSFNNVGNLASDDNYIEIPHVGSNALDITGTELTIEVWARMYYPAPQDAPFVVKSAAVNQESFMIGTQNGSNAINRRITSSTADTDNRGWRDYQGDPCLNANNGHYRYDDGYIADADWHYFTLVYDGSDLDGTDATNLKTFIDNSLQTFSKTGSCDPYPYGNINSNTGDTFLGRRIGNRFFKGAMDEVRISNTARSDSWIITTYNTINDPSSFYTVGNQEYPLEGGTATASNSQVDTGEGTTITLTGYDLSAALQWQSSSDNSSFSDISSENDATLSTGALTQTTYFRMKSTLSGCDAFSTTAAVSVRAGFIADYAYRSIISIDHTKVDCSSSLTNFPLLVSLTGNSDLQQANGKVKDANGYDIIFTNESGFVLDHDLESYNGTNGDLVTWVRIPTLFCSANTVVYMYYGNCNFEGGGGSDQSSNSTWTSYNGVYHMNDDPLNSDLTDRTSNGNDGTANGFLSDTRVIGKIGQAIELDGTDDYFDFGTGPQQSGTLNRTYEAWIYTETYAADDGIFQAGSPAGSDFSLHILNTNIDNFEIERDTDNDDFTLVSSQDNWRYIALSYDNSTSTTYLYYEGVLHSSFNGGLNTTPFALELGRWNGAEFDGFIDEFKVSSVARSSEWIKTQFNNQNSPSTFYSLEDEVSEFVWTGDVDTDWNNDNNWSNCTVPTSTDDAIFNTGSTFYPILTGNQSANYVNIGTGSSLDLAGFQLSIGGDFKNDGTFTHNNGSIVLNGTGEQNIKGANSIDFYDLQLNKSSGEVIINRDVSVENTLTLTSGNIRLNDINLIITSTGSISGGSASSFIETSTSSCLTQQDIGSTGRTGDIVYPVGSVGSTYTPVTINNTAGTADDFCVFVCENVYSGGGCSGTQLTAKVVNKTWDISPNTGTGLDVTATFQWNGSDAAGDFDYTYAYLAHYTGGKWDSYTPADISGQSDPYTLSLSGISTFSSFGAGSDDSALPVDLVYFTGFQYGSGVTLEWETASELDNDRFEIEKSSDGINFSKISQIKGQGTINHTSNYYYQDMLPIDGLNYYRLKQIDYSGSFQYSEVRNVNYVDSRENISVFPNPSSDRISISELHRFSGKVMLTYTDLSGKIVLSQSISNATEQSSFDISSLSRGQYILHIVGENRVEMKRVVRN